MIVSNNFILDPYMGSLRYLVKGNWLYVLKDTSSYGILACLSSQCLFQYSILSSSDT